MYIRDVSNEYLGIILKENKKKPEKTSKNQVMTLNSNFNSCHKNSFSSISAYNLHFINNQSNSVFILLLCDYVQGQVGVKVCFYFENDICSYGKKSVCVRSSLRRISTLQLRLGRKGTYLGAWEVQHSEIWSDII